MTQQLNPLKILAIGSPLSEISLLAQKVLQINQKHGPFDACVVTGDLFKDGSDGSEVQGVAFSVPTYFTLGKNALPPAIQDKIEITGGEVVDNLIFLGKSKVFVTSQGLKIGCVGGSYSPGTFEAPDDPYSPYITRKSIETILKNPILASSSAETDSLALAKQFTSALPTAFQGIDILLLSSPSPSLANFSSSFASSGISLVDPAPPLDQVVRSAKPRYLLWGTGNGFWEREPCGWNGPNGKEERWTRVVKLGELGGEAPAEGKKARWFYAFTLPPQATSSPLPVKPTNTTPNPFIQAVNNKKRNASDVADDEPHKKGRTGGAPPPDDYVCKVCSQPGHWIQECPLKSNRSRPPPGYKCKICQSSDHFIRECPNKEDKPRAPRAPPQGYVCRACGVDGQHYIKDCPLVVEREEAKAKKKELGPAECWFCLSNPKVTKHLIVAIGTETYVTLPKGQLIPTIEKDKPLVPGGGHVLIIPIAHHPTLLSIPIDDAMSIISEIESFKSSLRACYESYGAEPVSFEVGRLGGRGGHAHVQIIPVPKALADKVESSFRNGGAQQGIDWEPEPERALARAGSSGNYFKVECPDGTKLVHMLKGHSFDLQFGRRVLGSLLSLQHRIDWKDCAMSDAAEKEDAVKFKKAFAPFHS
nr:nuclear protein [Cryptococcus depauperatus CBS 7855]